MLWIPIDRSMDVPLVRQIYTYLREQILDGKLPPGEKLPSTRELSLELKISRNVILESYDQLSAEGFLTSRRGSGTFVSEGAILKQHSNMPSSSPFTAPLEIEADRSLIDFRSGIPALDLFPRRTWAKLSHALWNDTSPAALNYATPEGRPELRHILAQYLLKMRGVSCHPDQIIITSGATQAMVLVSRLLLSIGDTVIMEDPITDDIQTIFKTAGAVLHPVPVDDSGLRTDLLPKDENPKFIYITPSHQFPMGGTLPIQRRIQLIKYARQKNCYLVEDDYDSEFRYEGAPVHSLQGLEPERVIYIGSFSKILSPALRLGYLILPAQLIQTCRELKWLSDLHTPSMDQLILAQFIESGGLERHIAKMKKVYKSRRDLLKDALETAFADKVNITGDSTGLHLIGEFRNRHFSGEDLKGIAKDGVKLYSVEDHAIEKGYHANKLIFGYGHLHQEEIENGVVKLFDALSKKTDANPR